MQSVVVENLFLSNIQGVPVKISSKKQNLYFENSSVEFAETSHKQCLNYDKSKKQSKKGVIESV